MRYRKKPIVIEAFQMTKANRDSNEHWPQWMHDAWNKDENEPGAIFPGSGPFERLHIFTLEGTHRVSEGDWIIKGVQGELYPCKPDIFAATYETAGMPPAGMPNHDRRGVEQGPFNVDGETVTPDAA